MRPLVVASLLFAFPAAAQVQLERSLLASTGRSSSAAGITLEASLGDLVVTTATSTGLIVTQGFHQAVPDFTTSLEPNELGEVSAFPNPVREILFLRGVGLGAEPWSLEMFDASGRSIPVEIQRTDDGAMIDMHGYASGPYQIRILQQRSTVHVFRVVKQQ